MAKRWPSWGLRTKEWAESPRCTPHEVCALTLGQMRGMKPRTTVSQPLSAATVRRWLIAGIAGLLVVLALPTIWDVWQIDRAGILLNRAIVTGADAAAHAGSAGGSGSAAVVTAGGDYLLTPKAKALLERSLAIMDSAASRGPHTASREIPIWRTYGAAARLLPSDHAYELLMRSRSAGRLDWLGELWLGDVASSTGHWDVAAEAYRRVDVSNLLVYRAEAHIASGQKDLAQRELALAKISLDAQVEREKAELLLLDRTGVAPSSLAGVMERPAERATTLSRIGHGFLSIGQPAQAQPVLEQGLAVAASSSPGVSVERNLRFDLASTLAQTLPASLVGGFTPSAYSYYPEPGPMARLRVIIRIRDLVYQALALQRSGATLTQGARILLTIGDEAPGLSLLTEATTIDPTYPDSYLVLGAWYESHDLGYLARGLYAEAAVLMPTQPTIAAALAISTFNTLSHAEALPLLEHAAALNSTNPWVFAFLSDSYRELGRAADAKAALEEGLRRSPGAQSLTSRLAELGRAAGGPQ
jgi:tetratricopeptide (TPR) repeat protein